MLDQTRPPPPPETHRPGHLDYKPYAELDQVLTEPLYVGLSADDSRRIFRTIQGVTKSPYCHAMLIGRGKSKFLLTESTTPCSQVVFLEDRLREGDDMFQPQAGLIDVFRVIPPMDLKGAWDWSLCCAGEPYSIMDNVEIWLKRYRGLPWKVTPDNDEPKGCKRDCSCQVHAALHTHGLKPLAWPDENGLRYDCMVAPRDLCADAHPALFKYVCTPVWQ